MRVNTDHKYAVRSSGGAQTTKMSFDENSLGFLMDVMTNLYSDTVMAPIREYPSNALDSHREAGVERPVEITLPTRMHPIFVVRDFGLGMSVDDINKIYSKYGYSTKRDTDVASGMLGLGSKSALTYTDQFSVIAVKNGVKTMATVGRGEDGTGEINILDTSQTDEGNGVTIKIPVHDVNTFHYKAREFFRWWEPGTVLIDGEEPEYPENDTVKISDDIIIHRDNLDEDYVVMGCVAYPVGKRLSDGLPYGYHVVAYVPMGAVNFPPNREGLQYTRRTEKVIESLVTRRKELTKRVAERDIATAVTHADAIRTKEKWKRILSLTPQYKGKDLPSSFTSVSTGKTYPDPQRETIYVYSKRRPARYRKHSTYQVEAPLYVESLVITGFTNKDFTAANRNRVKHYEAQQGIDYDVWVIVESDIAGEWNDGVRTVTWDEIKAMKMPRKSRGGTVGLFDIRHPDGSKESVEEVEADDIIIVSPAFFTEKSRWDASIDWYTLRPLFPDTTFAILAKNRWDKFARENDNVRTLEEAMQEYRDEFLDNLNHVERLQLQGDRMPDGITLLDADKIDDPAVADMVRDVQAARNVSQDWTSIQRVFRVLEGSCSLDIIDSPYDEVLDRYPALRYSGNMPVEHMHDYINLFYKENS